MRDNSNIKTIKELCAYTFHIPDYQRNYRWIEKEVKQLSNGICKSYFDNFKAWLFENDNIRYHCVKTLITAEYRNYSKFICG